MEKSPLATIFLLLAIVGLLSLRPETLRAEETAARQQLAPFDFDPSIAWGTKCVFPGLTMSPEARILAVWSNYSHKSPGAGIQISYDFGIGNQEEARLIKVAVDWPGEPVILILNGYAPGIWQLSFTLDSRLEAVFVTGQDRQIVVGLPPDVPLLNSSQYNGGVCGYSYYHSPNDWPGPDLISQARQIFGRAPDFSFIAKDGYALLSRTDQFSGGPFYTAEKFEPERYRYPGTPPAKGAGLRKALDEGLIRPATEADRRQWQQVRTRNSGVDANSVQPISFQFHSPEALCNAEYAIVSEKFIFPAGFTHDAYCSPVFYLPPGIALPHGNPDNSYVLFLEDGRCLGPNCAGRLRGKYWRQRYSEKE